MKALLAVTALAAVVIGARTSPAKTRSARASSQVQVHCPSGNNAAFVTPQQVRIAVGDSVEWAMSGPVASDSLIITLKDPTRAWPFSGNPPRGQGTARSGRAATRGTFAYAVSLICRVQGGGTQPVVIDPDIIIE